MKDIMKPCHHSVSDDIDYKEVVVIGNGPSGMVCSYMLAGNVPHLKEIPEDLPLDEMLKARLSHIPPGSSLYETDLSELAEGLEGRSQNPIPVLMDILLRPCADLGIQAEPLIEWKFDAEKQVDHIVLGRTPPGGSWHSFPASMKALSPPEWLTLPPHTKPKGHRTQRITAEAATDYYTKYVTACGLQRYFRNGVVVHSVTRVPTSTVCESRTCPLQARFCVCGYEIHTGRSFRYYCDTVVVACGAADRNNSLDPSPPYAVHSLQTVEAAVNAHQGPGSILIVGSGVSAADAVRAARPHMHVYHAHRHPATALAALHDRDYPEHAQVLKMMLEGPSGNYPNYTSLSHHVILDVTAPPNLPENDVTTPKNVRLLNLKTNQVTHISVLLIAVLIGSKPDLNFLKTQHENCHKCQKNPDRWCFLKNVIGQGIKICKSKYTSISECGKFFGGFSEGCNCDSEGVGFGVDLDRPVDSRNNPLAIDKGSHQLIHSPPGMFALGPVTADNFIRFLPGGALAIVSYLHKEKKQFK